jgi:hypothetical protein
MPPAGKVMPTLFFFFHSQGILIAHLLKRGENMNSALYLEVLLKRRVQFAENVQANWLEGYSIMTMSNHIQPM